MKLKDIYLVESQKKVNKELLTEVLDGIPLREQKIILSFQKDLKNKVTEFESSLMLMEQDLNTTQITDVFKATVEYANNSGENRTAIGKTADVVSLPIDLAKWIDKKVNSLGTLLQNTSVVTNLDTKFADLKKEILAKNNNSKIVSGIEYLSDVVKKHPGKATFVVAVLTGLAAIVGGPLGGAAGGFLLNSANKLLQGEKLSTAVGTSLKTAVYGAIAGLAFRWLSKELIEAFATAENAELENLRQTLLDKNVVEVGKEQIANNPELTQFLAVDKLQRVTLNGSFNELAYNYDLLMTPEQYTEYQRLSAAMPQFNLDIGTASAETIKAGMVEYEVEARKALMKTLDYLTSIQQDTNQDTLKASVEIISTLNKTPDLPKLTAEQIEILNAAGKEISNRVVALEKLYSGVLSGIVQAVVQQSKELRANIFKKKPITPVTESLELNESTFKDIAIAMANKVASFKDNRLNKVTMDRLITAWKKSGKPTDSTKIIELISDFIDVENATKIVNTYGPEKTIDEIETIVKKINNLPDEEKEAMITYISAQALKK